MKQNVGNIERVIRVVAVPLLTGLVGWCPPYALLGFSTCGKCSTPLKQS
jgi:Protein of unknown function (DUF2892)